MARLGRINRKKAVSNIHEGARKSKKAIQEYSGEERYDRVCIS
jgi:hypothetical protein